MNPPAPSPWPEPRDAVLADAAERARRYLATLDERAVAPAPEAIARLRELDVPLQRESLSAAQVIAELDEIVGPATMGMAGPRFFGFVIGGALPAAMAANWLATAWDQNAALAKITPGVSTLEDVALRWIVDLLGLPAGTQGAFVTGATMANCTALAAARNHVLKRVGWNVEGDGLYGAPPVTIVVGGEVHPTLTKSLGVLGFGRNRVVRVPVDDQGRMRADAFPALPGGPAIVCLQAGNLNTGAFGLWAKASPTLAPLARGLERADSWATDAHKWLNVPYDCGIALVREPGTLPAAMAVTAEYLPTEGTARNPADYTPELSRRARGVDVWAAMRSLGREGLAELFARNVRQAQSFARQLRAAGCEVLNDVVLNQVLVSFGEPAHTLRAIDALQREGTCWCGSTVWQGRTALRISVCSYRTSDADVDRSVAAMLKAARG